jgi:exopolyphosphatase/guanosine-5'-triphosphate,3'-diphosphate pyrophosphatase
VSFAALDCGSNSTRLLIIDDQGRSLAREMRITRLGEGVDATGRLGDQAVERCYATLREYRTLMDQHGVTRSALVATSAARDATNGEKFLSAAAAITGADVALLSGNEEARLSFLGATADLPSSSLPTMILDIGGGSSELAVEVAGGLATHSMQLGCVRVAERVLGHGVVNNESRAATLALIESELDHLFDSEPRFTSVLGAVRLVGLAGTVATLAQLDAGTSLYDRALVHHRLLSRALVNQWRDRLASETPAQRLTHPGMVVGREDVLAAGLFILSAVMERFEVSELISSENDILDGVAATLRDNQQII